MLSATLMLQSTLIYGSDEGVKTLTLEQAIQSAQSTSVNLEMSERSIEIAGENAQLMRLNGRYDDYNAANATYLYMKKQQAATRDTIAFNMTQLFDNIFLLEAQRAQLETSIALQEKQMRRTEIQYEQGMQSELDLAGSQLKLVQTQQQMIKLEEDIDAMYRQLEMLTGKDVEAYQLEKPVLTFEPYQTVTDIARFAKGKAEDHRDMWKATEDARLAENKPIQTQNYIEFISLRAEREDKKDTAKQTEDNLVDVITDLYIQVKQLERDYETKQANLVIEEKQYLINRAYLEQGMISQIDYELSALQYETSVLELTTLMNQHHYAKMKLDNVQLITVSPY